MRSEQRLRRFTPHTTHDAFLDGWRGGGFRFLHRKNDSFLGVSDHRQKGQYEHVDGARTLMLERSGVELLAVLRPSSHEDRQSSSQVLPRKVRDAQMRVGGPVKGD